MRVTRPRAGFTILEVAVAASLLLATCVATTTVLSSATRADGAAELREHLRTILNGECQRLAALPFVQVDHGAESTGGTPAADSLVADVFPIARPELNTDARYFVGSSGGDKAGTFVSIRALGSAEIRTEAVFVAGDGSEPGHLGPSDLGGWDCASGAQPPAAILEISVQVSERGRTVARTTVLSALRPTIDASGSAGAG